MTARCDAGARLDDVHPRTRVPLELEELDPTRRATSTPRSSATRTASPRRPSPSCASAASASSTCRADFRLRDRGIYEDWYGEHGAPELFGEAVYGLPELHREQIARRRPRRQPRLLPDRGAARARAARARRADRRRRDRREVRRLGRRPRADRDARTSSPSTRTSTPYKVGAPPPHARDRAGARAAGRAVTVTFTPHLVPLAQGELVSCYVTPAREPTRTSSRRSTRRLRARAVGRGRRRGRPACSRCATRTTAASRCTTTRARAA